MDTPSTSPPPSDHSVTAEEVLLALAAAASVFVDVGVLTMNLSRSLQPSVGGGLHDALALLPHAVVFALALAGFRRTAALTALPVVGLGLFYGAVVVMLTLDPTYIAFVAVQALMLLVALANLRPLPATHVGGVTGRRVIGAGSAAAVLWCVAAAVTVSRHVEEQRTRAAVVDSIAGYARVQERNARTLWMEAPNFHHLVGLARCIERYRGDSAAAPPPSTIVAVQKWAMRPSAPDTDCRTLFAGAGDTTSSFAGFSEHARVRYERLPQPADPWRAGGYLLEVEAVWSSADEPVRDDAPGRRSFLMASDGTIHVTAEHRRATSADSTVPPCPPHFMGYEECSAFVPRQRWGVRTQLPSGWVAGPASVQAGDSAWFRLDYGTTAPIDVLRSVTVDWDDGRTTTRRTFPKPMSFGDRPLTFNETHVFTDPGRHIVRATFVARDGSRYAHADTIEVNP